MFELLKIARTREQTAQQGDLINFMLKAAAARPLRMLGCTHRQEQLDQ
jgi:hypothetical protein